MALSGETKLVASVSSLITASPWSRLDLLEVGITVGMITWLLPDTPISRPIDLAFWWALNTLGVSQQMGGWVFYAVGWVFCAILLAVYLRTRSGMMRKHPAVASLVDAVSVMTLLFMLDIALSTLNPYTPEYVIWPFSAFAAPFFLCALYLSARQCLRLLQVLAACTGIQALYGIFYYLTEQHQYHTPHFGSRTCGTFNSPNILYPLCLIGLPLCAAICRLQTRWLLRTLFAVLAVFNLAALALTYTRSGWLGIAVAALVTLRLPCPAWAFNRGYAGLALALASIGLAGTLFVRTNGRVIANAQDRSTLGRVQIWRVSLHVIAKRPWLGGGLSTYKESQTQAMTPALDQFNPMNSEAKSLYLNLWAESGLAGLAILLLLAYRYAQLYKGAISGTDVSGETSGVMCATAIACIAISVAGLADTPVLQAGRSPDTFALLLLVGASAAMARGSADLPAQAAQAAKPDPIRRRIKWILIGTVSVFALWTTASTLILLHRASPIMDHCVADLIDSNRAVQEPVPGLMVDALVAAEDRNYNIHNGVDWEALHRALRNDVRGRGGLQGGSTVTMQTVRYVMLPYDKTPARKIAQIVLALRLEKRLSKQQIIRLYFDSVSFGLHTAGLEQAARTYFNKRPKNLTLAECAFLVGTIAHPPADESAVTPVYAQGCKNRVLNVMGNGGSSAYTAETLEDARRAEFCFAFRSSPRHKEKGVLQR